MMLKNKSLAIQIWLKLSLFIIVFVCLGFFLAGAIIHTILISEKNMPNHAMYVFKLSKIIIPIAVFIGLGLIISKIVTDNILKPLKELELYSQNISNKNWDIPINLHCNNEIGNLARAMNEMQIKLKKADEEEKLFLQTMSHDLKTPVMVIMSHAQAIIDGVYIDNLENTADIIKNEAIRLNSKIQQILYFNSLNQILDNEECIEMVDLKELCSNVASKFKIVESNLQFNVTGDNLQVKGSQEYFVTVIENILDNQVRFAKTKIEITLSQTDNKKIIKIFNDGELIPLVDINKLFDYFYKSKKGNLGLGLATCKKIITHYGGVIEVENMEKGVCFRIIFQPMINNNL